MDLRQQHNVRQDNVGQVPQQSQYQPQQTGREEARLWWPSPASKILVALLAIAALIVLVAFALGAFGKPAHPLSRLVDKEGWQAVFLSNGQVYFGKITAIDNKMIILEDIYYLQVDQQIQPEQGEDAQSQEPQVTLAKLGSELHGPQDQMFISTDEVVFWENLKSKDDSQVVKAILDYKATGDVQGAEQPQEQPQADNDESANGEAPTEEQESAPLTP